MDRHHRPSRRKHRGTEKHVDNDHQSGRHERSTSEKRHSAPDDHTIDRSPLKLTSAIIPRIAGITELSKEDNYVRRWLAQTEGDDGFSVSQVPQPRTDRSRSFKKTQPDFGSFIHSTEDQPMTGSRNKQNRRSQSSDSSLLETAHIKKPNSVEKGKTDTERKEQSPSPPRKRKKQEPSGPEWSASPEDPSPNLEIFHKRARHKTKEDHYENKKNNQKKDTEKKSRPKREKAGNRRRAAKKASEDLMNNFTSKSIGSERLTVRPSQGPGLFRNGRASSPARKRGLPDLAFAEMDFLQRSGNNQPIPSKEMVISKSREKEKRKRARVDEEISEFFKPSKAPLNPTNSSALNQRSSASVGEGSIYERQKRIEDLQEVRGTKPSETPSLPRADRRSISRGLSRDSLRLEDDHDTASKLSGKATTYVSWSETQVSPGAALFSYQLGEKNRPASLTPDFVRTSLQKTGVFRDTGIDISSRSQRKLGNDSHPEAQDQGSSYPPKNRLQTRYSETATSIESSHNNPPKNGKSRSPRDRDRDQHKHIEGSDTYLANQNSEHARPNSRDESKEANQRHSFGNEPSKVRIETHKQRLGQQPIRDIRMKGEHNGSPEQASKPASPPFTREQLANSARIKRLPSRLHIDKISNNIRREEVPMPEEGGKLEPRDEYFDTIDSGLRIAKESPERLQRQNLKHHKNAVGDAGSNIPILDLGSMSNSDKFQEAQLFENSIESSRLKATEATNPHLELSFESLGAVPNLEFQRAQEYGNWRNENQPSTTFDKEVMAAGSAGYETANAFDIRLNKTNGSNQGLDFLVHGRGREAWVSPGPTVSLERLVPLREVEPLYRRQIQQRNIPLHVHINPNQEPTHDRSHKFNPPQKWIHPEYQYVDESQYEIPPKVETQNEAAADHYVAQLMHSRYEEPELEDNMSHADKWDLIEQNTIDQGEHTEFQQSCMETDNNRHEDHVFEAQENFTHTQGRNTEVDSMRGFWHPRRQY